jgi:signal transduction histidine kinase
MPIDRKLTAILLFASIATLLTVSVIVLSYEVAIYRDEVPERIQVVGAVIADQLAYSLERGDAVETEKHLSGLRQESSVTTATVYDTEWQVLARYARDPDSTATARTPAAREIPPLRSGGAGYRFVGGKVIVWVPVAAGMHDVGTLEIVRGMELWTAEMRQYLAWFGVVFLLCIVMSILLARMLQRLITAPLIDLDQLARRVSAEKNYDLRITNSGRDEIGALAAGFNEMLGEISLRDRQLQEHRAGLEAAIAKRTAELSRARDAAEDANRAKNAFMAMTSHELRTPLNAIMGFSALLVDGSLGAVPPEQLKPLTIIYRSSEELYQLVLDILDLSNIEAGNLVVRLAEVPLRAVLEEQAEAFSMQIRERNLESRSVECDDAVVLADRTRLSQVVRALVTNAVKFTDEGHIQIRSVRSGRFARIEILDSGIGIAAEDQTRLFRAFQRIEGPSRGARPGTGLGLAICRRIVVAMGGEIGLESAPGRGSVFWFTVPLSDGPNSPAAG